MYNKIFTFREALGLTQKQLGDLMGTSQQYLGRLEKKKTSSLSVRWLQKAAAALEVRIEDLLDSEQSEMTDVSGVADDNTLAPIAAALVSRGLALFQVDTDVVSEMGVGPGALLMVDTNPDAINDAKTGDLVLVETASDEARLLLRVLVRPSLVTTNRRGANTALHLENPAIRARLAGVVVPNKQGSSLSDLREEPDRNALDGDDILSDPD